MSKESPQIKINLTIQCGSMFQHQVFSNILLSFLMALKGMEKSHKKNKINWEYPNQPTTKTGDK